MSSKRRPLPDPEDVLEGKARGVTAALLLRLIQEVNPTGADLPEDETARRYEQKDRLIGLLVRRFPESLDVSLERPDDGRVSISRRHFPDEACHAVLSRLAPDVCSWIRRRLDECESGDPATDERGRRQSARTKRALDPLEAGQRALEEYDFERAKECFEAAVARSRGAVGPTRALVELLVEHLAAYDEALDLAEGPAHADPTIRLLLALAAARTGRTERAIELASGLEDPRAADVWIALARHAVAQGRLEATRSHLAKVWAIQPSHSEIPGLAAELRGLGERERAGLLERLARARDKEDTRTTEALARRILERWPTDEAARSALAEVDRARSLVERRAIETRARDAERREDHFEAARLWLEAVSLGADGPALEARIAACREAGRARAARERLEDVESRLGIDLRDGLLAYLQLEPALRRALRERSDHEAMGWLESIGVVGTGKRAEKAVAAVLALNRAREEDAAGRLERAGEILRPYADILGVVGEAAQLLEEAERAATLARADRVRELCHAVESALAAGDLERARARLGSALEFLPREDRDRLERHLAKATALAIRIEDLRKRIEAKDLLRARKELAALIEEAGEVEGARWGRLDAKIEGRIREAWAVREHDPPPEIPLRFLVRNPFQNGVAPVVVPGTDRAILCDALDQWLFLLEVDLGSGRPVRARSVRCPMRMDHPTLLVTADSVTVASHPGGFVRLGLEDGLPRDWLSLRDLLDEPVVFEGIWLAEPDRVFCQVRAASLAGGTGLAFLDLHRRSVQLHPLAGQLRFIGGRVKPVLAELAPLGSGVILHSAEGRKALSIPTTHPVWEIESHPDNRRFLAIVGTETGWNLLILDPTGEDSAGTSYRFANPEGEDFRFQVALGPGETRALVGLSLEEMTRWICLDFSSSRPWERWAVSTTCPTSLIGDRVSRRVWLLHGSGEVCRPTPLGVEKPVVPSLPAPPRSRPVLPSAGSFQNCRPEGRSTYLEFGEDWARIEEALGEVDADGLAPAARRHHQHLLGLARLRTSSAADACRAWEEGLAFEGPCDLLSLLEMVRPLPQPGPDESDLVRTRRALAEVDRLLDGGDSKGALAVLEQHGIDACEQTECLARLARCHLESTAGRNRFDLAAAIGMARFLDRLVHPTPWLRSVDLATPEALSLEALARLAERCTERLGSIDAPTPSDRIDLNSHEESSERADVQPGVPRPCLQFGLPLSGRPLMATLSFEYDGVWLDAGSPGETVRQGPNERVMARRDLLREAEEVDRLRTLGAKPGASTARWTVPEGSFVALVRALVAQGWSVEAEKKPIRVPGAIKVWIGSGMDWFELEGWVEYGERRIPMSAVLSALVRRRGMVELGDSSYGILPEEWLSRHAGLLTLAESAGGRLRFRRSQAVALERLSRDDPEIERDEAFEVHCRDLATLLAPSPVDPPAGFAATLRPYQRLGLGWLLALRSAGLGGCLADDMGLGKTIQVLALLASVRKMESHRLPFLVVCPRSLLENWIQEARRFVPDLAAGVHHGPGRLEGIARLADLDLVVTSYGTLRIDVDRLAGIRFDTVVLDEAQAIKNAASQSARAARALSADHRLALTGPRSRTGSTTSGRSSTSSTPASPAVDRRSVASPEDAPGGPQLTRTSTGSRAPCARSSSAGRRPRPPRNSLRESRRRSSSAWRAGSERSTRRSASTTASCSCASDPRPSSSSRGSSGFARPPAIRPSSASVAPTWSRPSSRSSSRDWSRSPRKGIRRSSSASSPGSSLSSVRGSTRPGFPTSTSTARRSIAANASSASSPPKGRPSSSSASRPAASV